MGAVRTDVLGGLRRRRAPTIVLAFVLLLATGASTLALSILVESQAPFDHAFAEANGAHLVVDYEATLDAATLGQTGSAPGVIAAAGPWSVGGAGLADPSGGIVQGLVMSDRSSPDTAVDRVAVDSGRWWQAPGEAVLGRTTALLLDLRPGDTIDVTWSAPDKDGSGGQTPAAPTRVHLTVVGIAASISTPDVAVWMSPADLAALIPTEARSLEMLYRVDPSATEGDLVTALTSITGSLPSGAVVATHSWLDVKLGSDRVADLFVPILLAFSIFALLAAAFTIVNIVSGIVLSGVHDFGVLASIGFTPRQITASVAGQVVVPATIGTVAGVVLGTLISRPVVDRAAASFGLPAAAAASGSVVLPVLATAMAVVLGAAIIPAMAAGRMRPAEALARGSLGGIGGHQVGRRRGLGLPLPVPTRLGIGAGAAHPVRATMTLGALVVGVAAATFALGLNWSLLRVADDLSRIASSPIRVELPPSRPGGKVGGTGAPPDTVSIARTIASDPETDRWVGLGSTQVTAAGIGSIPLVVYDGDAGWLGFTLVSGRWFAGPGEIVAPTSFFTATGRHLGDRVALATAGRTVMVTLVGEYFFTGGGRDAGGSSKDAPVLRGDWADAAALDPSLAISGWEARPRAGADVHDYLRSLQDALGTAPVQVYEADQLTSDATFLLFLGVTAFLGIVLVSVSLAGVFNTVLLETRHRAREIGILKAIGLTPREVVVMVVSTVIPVALLAGLLGVPLGIVAQRAVLAHMGHVAAGTAIPESVFDVFGPLLLLALALSGLGIAALGALGPATRAARARIAPVLQAE